MPSISKIEQFRQVKSDIQKNKDNLLVGLDSSKKSSVGCFYNIEKEVLLKKYYVNHNLEDIQRFICKIEQIMEIHNFKNIIIGVEPTGNYHKPLAEYLKSKGYFVVYVSSVAANQHLFLFYRSDGVYSPHAAVMTYLV